jgi:hypothetical protein
MYNNRTKYDPLKLKEIIIDYTRKTTFNAGGVTLHSVFYTLIKKSKFLPLRNEKLDTFTKYYKLFFIVIIYETSLIGSTFLYQIYKRRREIKHSPTKYLGNVDIIFCGDLY